MSKDLYVKNLSPQTTEEDLRNLFAVAGKVTYIHMVIDPKTDQFLGCAYVKMSSEAEAKEAINSLHEARYMNAYISVGVALPRTAVGSVKPVEKCTPRPPAAVGAKKIIREERAIAKGDWTAPGPAKKERSATSSRRKEGGKSDFDWTASAEKPSSLRRKPGNPARDSAPKKGAGPKRNK